MLPVRDVIRIARKLESVWVSRSHSTLDTSRSWRQFDAVRNEINRIRDRIRLATRYHLELTLPRLQDDLGGRLADLGIQLEQLRAEHKSCSDTPPNLVEWIREVRQLEDEFGAVEVRWADQILRVVTEAIILREVHLGPFAIEFGWEPSRCSRGIRSFDVIALEPNPAAGREDVVHPHVEGQRLCGGDATEPVREAIEDGRLADAFLLIRSVLTNYNPGSPYVPLDQWDGFHCSECGRRDDSRSQSHCDGCDNDLCGQCTDSCARCSDTRCHSCLTPCDVCDERLCQGCLALTPSQRLVCPDCRGDCTTCGARIASDEIEAGRCSTCREAAEANSSDESESIPTEEVVTDAQ